MTRKDFELIAAIIRHMDVTPTFSASAKIKVAETFSRDLRFTNPRFDSERFLRACRAIA